MPTSSFESVNEYIASQPDPIRPILEQVCVLLRKAIPGAEETISYKIPAWKLDGEPVLYLAGWKQHFSLYPATRTLIAAFQDEIAPYVNKSTLKFPLAQPVPVRLIERIAKFRAQEVAAKARSATPKKS